MNPEMVSVSVLLTIAVIAGIWGISHWRKTTKHIQEAAARQSKAEEELDKTNPEYRKTHKELDPIIEVWTCPRCQTLNCAEDLWVKRFEINVDGKPLGKRCMVCFYSPTGIEETQKLNKLQYQRVTIGKMLTLELEQKDDQNQLLLELAEVMQE